MFIEIDDKKETTDAHPTFIEFYYVNVNPHQCGSMVRWLSKEVPRSMFISLSDNSKFLFDMSYLKRVRKISTLSRKTITTASTDNEMQFKQNEQTATNTSSRICNNMDEQVQLHVLLGPVDWLDQVSDEERGKDSSTTRLDVLLRRMNEELIHCTQTKRKHVDNTPHATTLAHHTNVLKVLLPSRMAQSEIEWDKFKRNWPMNCYPNKWIDSKLNDKLLSENELNKFVVGMKAAIQDSFDLSETVDLPLGGAVVVESHTSTIVSKSSIEFSFQAHCFDKRTPLSHQIMLQNPLFSEIVLACQGVSRIERENATTHGLTSTSFQKGQYLCTGYDLFCTREPSVFEAMALVHFRINRLVFGCGARKLEGSRVGKFHHDSGITEMQVHTLPGTNHNYKAYQCEAETDLWRLCFEQHSKMPIRNKLNDNAFEDHTHPHF